MCGITECDGNPLLVINYLNRYVLGLAVIECLLCDMRHVTKCILLGHLPTWKAMDLSLFNVLKQ